VRARDIHLESKTLEMLWMVLLVARILAEVRSVLDSVNFLFFFGTVSQARAAHWSERAAQPDHIERTLGSTQFDKKRREASDKLNLPSVSSPSVHLGTISVGE
jgi:hypothetical protein